MPRIFWKERRRLILTVLIVLILAVLIISSPPKSAPVSLVITVQEGTTLKETTEVLKTQRVIRSKLWLRTLVALRGGAQNIKAGEYTFEEPQGAWRIAGRLTKGVFLIDPVRVRIAEGATREEMAQTLSQQLSRFNTREFLRLTQEKEGFLFPDTYFFLPTTNTREVVAALEDTFHERVAALSDEIATFGKPLEDVVIMASLLEREARQLETRQKIAGILWKRLEINMPLQVDAVFLFLLGKGSAELTRQDLEIDSPYNTYRYVGLPVGPIGSPSFESLLAAVTPIESEYLFYLADNEGVTHYAINFEQHKANKARYLR